MSAQHPKQTSYWVSACVLFDRPILADSGERVRGYYVQLGIRCSPSELRSRLEGIISDGNIDWHDTTWERRDPSDVDDGLIRSRMNAHAEFVWYRSGRILFP